MAALSSDKTVEQEEEEVQTDEETSDSLLDSINYRLSLIMEDEVAESHQKPQEYSTMMQRTMERGSTSFSSDHNPRLAPQYRSTDQMSQVMMPLEEQVSLSVSLISEAFNQIPRSDQTLNLGSTTFSSHQVMMPIEEQIPRSDQTLNRGSTTFSTHQVMMPIEEQVPRCDHQTVNHDSTTFSSDSLETESPFQQQQRLTTSSVMNQYFGTQHQLFPMMFTKQQPGWFIRDHSSAPAWRPQILMPFVDHQHPMANQLANIEGLQNQTFVPRPLFGPAQTYFVQEPLLSGIALNMYRYYPYMRPEDNHMNLRMPRFRSELMFTLTSPSGQPSSFVLLQDQFNPHQSFVLSLDDALVYGPVLEMDPLQPQQRQHLDLPIDMIHRQPPPSAPRPQVNHQQTQPQMQTQRLDDGPSSHKGQDQQQP